MRSKNYDKLIAINTKKELYRASIQSMFWDISTISPSKGKPFLFKAIKFLNDEMSALDYSKEAQDLADYYFNRDLSDEIEMAMARELLRSQKIANMLSQKQQKQKSALELESLQKHQEAKAKKDYQIVAPYLERIVGMHKLAASNVSGFANAYDAALYCFEDGGLTVEYIDSLFSELYKDTSRLLKKLKDAPLNNIPSIMPKKNEYDMKKLQEVSEYAAKIMGFDPQKGFNAHIDIPFTMMLGPNESRISSNYDQFVLGFFVTIHEMGHGIYSYSSPHLEGTDLWSGHMGSLHESQSRFYENILGRTPEFMTFMYPKFKETFSCFKDVSVDTFIRNILQVKPTLRRIESDEVTYNMHIFIRYEMEKLMMLNDDVNYNELNDIWNDMYKKYLGIEPGNDLEGILQDPHWYQLGMGYFPAYAIGNIYSGQIRHAMLKNIPDALQQVKNGDFTYINKWLYSNIHQYGKIHKPQEIIKRVTKEKAATKYFIDYLEEKYYNVFEISG